jgi:hypothetical protein
MTWIFLFRRNTMGTSLYRFLLHLFAVTLICAVFSVGQAFAEGDEEEELPQKGTLSANVTGGTAGGVAVDGVWGGDDMWGEEPSPITGSVSKLSKREWVMKLINNSEDKYSVSVTVEQFNDKRKKVRGNNYSYTLDGGEKRDRVVKVLPQTETCSLKLKRWRNLTPKKKEGEGEEAKAAK